MADAGQSAVLAEGETLEQHEKKWQYRLEVVTHDFELEKIKSAELEAKCIELKRRMEDGESRGDKIKKISALVADFKHQLDEAHAEIDRLHQENQALRSQLEAAGLVPGSSGPGPGACAVPYGVNPDDEALGTELQELKADNATLMEKLRLQEEQSRQPTAAVTESGRSTCSQENDILRASLLSLRGQLEKIKRQVAQHVCHSGKPTHAMPPTPALTLEYDLQARSHYERIMTDIEQRDPGHLARVNEDINGLRARVVIFEGRPER